MSILNDTAVDSQVPAAEQSAIPAIDEATAKKMEQNESGISRIVSLAVATLDPKDMLKKYAALGAAVFKHAKWQKSQFPAWAKEDFKRLADKIAEQVKFQVAIRDVRMDTYVRVHLWVEAVKPLVSGVEKLSYYQVANKFLPTLDFDPVELTGEIKKEWLGFVRTTVERQLSDSPLSMKELDTAIEDQKKAIERERNAKKDPEKALLAEQKAAEAKARKERNAAQSKIAESIDAALASDHANAVDVATIVEKVLADHKLAMPKVGFNPADCTVEDCKLLANAMFAAGKLAEMKALRDRLDMMLKVAENRLIQTQAG